MANNVAEIIIRAKDEATPAINQMGSKLSGLINNQFVQGTLAIAGFNAGLGTITSAISSVVGEASKLENAIADFTTLTGSMDDARKMVDQLRELGAKTPFEFLDLSSATKTLLGFGAATKENLIPTLRMLGDVSGGNSERLNLIALAFGQIQAAGKASMQDINQLIANGVPIIGELASGFGVSVGEMRKMVEQGKATSDEVTKAFQRMTSEGGLFYGSMERASKTLSGRWSTFIDETKAMAASLGDNLLPILGSFLDIASKIPNVLKTAFQSSQVKDFFETIERWFIDLEFIAKTSTSIIKMVLTQTFDPNTYKVALSGLFAAFESITDGSARTIIKYLAHADKLFGDASAENERKRDAAIKKINELLGIEENTFKTMFGNVVKADTIKNNEIIKAANDRTEKINAIEKRHQEQTTETVVKGEKDKTNAVKGETEEQKKARLKALEEQIKAEKEFTRKSIEEADKRVAEIKKGEVEYREFLADLDEQKLKDKEKHERDKLEQAKAFLDETTWQEDINSKAIQQIYKYGIDSKEAMSWKFVAEHKKIIGIMSGFEKDKADLVNDYIKEKIKDRVQAFAAGLIAEVTAWGIANALWTFGGSLALAGVAVAGISAAAGEAGAAIDRAFAKPKKSEDQKIREELEQEAQSRSYQDKKEAMRKILYPDTAKTPTTSTTTASTQSVSTMTAQSMRSSGSQTIEVVVQLDKQTLGRAIVDLQRQQAAGVL